MASRLEIDLRVLFDLVGRSSPDTRPSDAVLDAMVRDHFSFLPQPIEVEFDGWQAVITYAEVRPSADAEADRLTARAANRAAEGEYQKAISLWRRALKLQPTDPVVRRDLAMALFEQGEVEEAKDHLLDVLRIQPDDVWSLVVLANLYLRHEKNQQTAERLLDHALVVDPGDPWALNSMAALRMEQGRFTEGLDLFAKCMAANPSFANPYLGLAMAHERAGCTEEAKLTLEQLFAHGDMRDARSAPIFTEARTLYGSLMSELAVTRQDEAAAAVDAMKDELACLSGYPIRVRPAQVPGGTAASIQMAWKYGRDHHLIVHREDYRQDLLLHLTAHELGHLRLESAARAVGKNRLSVSTAATRKRTSRSLSKDIARWQQQGLPEQGIADLTTKLTDGIARQLFNTPIDMLIEEWLHREVPALRAAQFVSLAVLAKEAEESASPRVAASLPRHVVRASAALNGATALFLDTLYSGATAYADTYRGLDTFSVSERLFAMLTERKDTLAPGDEYDLVDAWVEVLGLEGWFEWAEDEDKGAAEQMGAGTEDEMLRERHPAAVWYFLGALERFEQMTDAEIQGMAFEVSMIGMNGLDYTDSDKKYTLTSLPGEEFSGLQLMCLMFAGFARIAPEEDVGMDLGEPYREALGIYRSRGGGSG